MQQNNQEGGESPFAGYIAKIVEINAKKTGICGELYVVSCVIDDPKAGKDKGRIIRRNMLGPAKVGDRIRLPDTSREAKNIQVK
ncbi:MAG: 30S ribosomal protein S28e [Candidatus Micrarchaeia archaeon]